MHTWGCEGSGIVNTAKKLKGLTLPDFKTYYKLQ